MKNILFVLLLTISSILSFAGVIMTSSNERLEDVTITSETDSAIVYIQDNVEKSALFFYNKKQKKYTKSIKYYII